MMNLVPVGVDIAKLKFDVAVQLPNQKYKTKKFANTPAGCREFLNWLSLKKGEGVHRAFSGLPVPYPLANAEASATSASSGRTPV
ncbi:hypothetical protein ACMYSL_27325 [Klebsiella sp. MISC125]|uniref:hypothetical protein n=1 Tax=Klebsiella sp. MISC125 TaxID=2755386 RepID=UPI003DA94195